MGAPEQQCLKHHVSASDFRFVAALNASTACDQCSINHAQPRNDQTTMTKGPCGTQTYLCDSPNTVGHARCHCDSNFPVHEKFTSWTWETHKKWCEYGLRMRLHMFQGTWTWQKMAGFASMTTNCNQKTHLERLVWPMRRVKHSNLRSAARNPWRIPPFPLHPLKPARP